MKNRIYSPANPEGLLVDYTAAEEAQRLKEIAAFEAELLDYSKNRAKEYPSFPDQLDEIYHNGIDSWKAVIKVTKDKYPKPE